MKVGLPYAPQPELLEDAPRHIRYCEQWPDDIRSWKNSTELERPRCYLNLQERCAVLSFLVEMEVVGSKGRCTRLVAYSSEESQVGPERFQLALAEGSELVAGSFQIAVGRNKSDVGQ